MTEKEQIAELLKNLPQVNHAEAAVHGLDYVFNCAADYLISHGVTITPAVPGPSEDASNNKDMYFKCGMRHMKAMVLAMLQDVLDQAGGFCIIDLSGVIKAVEDL